MASFSDVLGAFHHDGGAYKGAVPDNWLQGRTLYGGLSAALCLEGAFAAFADHGPLRSAQISFIGPAEGEISIKAEILRRGKSVSFVNTDLHCDKGLAVRAVFAFGAARDSIFDTRFLPPPDLPGPDEAPVYFPPEHGPVFARNFSVRLARGAMPVSASKEYDHFLWVRHKDDKAISLSALVALADMPPPAVFAMFPRPAPISTMTWSLNFLADKFPQDADWFLLEARAEDAAHGYSSQDMFVWDRNGAPLIAGRQSVAIFI